MKDKPVYITPLAEFIQQLRQDYICILMLHSGMSIRKGESDTQFVNRFADKYSLDLAADLFMFINDLNTVQIQ